ncbi:hypothetical protein Ae201684P_020074 [Aphanomyces euteiches]|uniref:Palmitoyltransferase n=1 Tax=Aphanomyces euteiches TaxID=100861 RepID=A0A6G0W546_9STRA|nr:hypothetical protein Ae201684_018682 [Aphanomyces euteiches]KAH9071815.1 hypothetical protein Ae201684P_020074 [Aphanomyces euteiches]KAH9144285.1 hypothetical protein AeRB84_011765 [Aphanomyces euteiches]
MADSMSKPTAPLKNYRWAYLIGCPLIKLLLLCLLLEIPGSHLRHTHRDKQWEWNWPEIQSLLLIVGAATLVFYAVQGSDPGYITEEMVEHSIEGDSLLNEYEFDVEDDLEASKAKAFEYQRKKIASMEATLASQDMTEDVSKPSEDVLPATTMEFCTTCILEPPLRAYHCGYCNRCVATFDHHCFCIGTCIGEKNHCRFWWFLFLTSIEVYTCIGIVHSGYQSAPTLSAWLNANSLALVATLFFWCFAFTAYSLFGFHTFLMLTNSTTRELGKGPEKLAYLRGTRECDLPFSNGVLRNLSGFCCIRAGCRRPWAPEAWKPVGKIERNAENICDNLWENKYYSCC